MKTSSIINKERNACCGCASCRDICPKEAISMVPDAEGFYYPVVDTEKCIDCGLCKKNCPTERHNLKNKSHIQATFCGRYKDPQRVKVVSSGGFCDAAANETLNGGGVVYGVGYSNDFHQVVVKRIDAKEELDQIRGSKYVQSIKSDGIYKRIKTDLKSGLKVLFIGVPCDVAAVKNYIGEFDNLTTIEIICSGVPSPEVHKQFVSYIEDKYKSKITSFTYRKKQYGWHWPYVEAKCGDKIIYNKSWSTMELGYAFMTLLRPSCYNCQFKSQYNMADVTVGDFWGLKKNDSRYYNNGVSAIITHTEKGTTLTNGLKDFDLKNSSYDEIKTGNPRLYSCPKPRVNRRQFSESFISKGLIRSYKESLTIKDRIRNLVMTIYSIFNLR